MCSILTLPCTTSYFPFTTGKSVTAALYRTRQRFFVGFVDWQPMTSSPTGCYRTYWCFTSSTSTPNRRRPALSNCYLFKKRWFSQETKQLAGELIAGKRPTLAKCITLGTLHTNSLPPSFLSYHSSFYQHVRAPAVSILYDTSLLTICSWINSKSPSKRGIRPSFLFAQIAKGPKLWRQCEKVCITVRNSPLSFPSLLYSIFSLKRAPPLVIFTYAFIVCHARPAAYCSCIPFLMSSCFLIEGAHVCDIKELLRHTEDSVAVFGSVYPAHPVLGKARSLKHLV